MVLKRFETVYLYIICSLVFLASALTEEAEALSEVFANTSSVCIDVELEKDKLGNLIKDHGLVIRYVSRFLYCLQGSAVGSTLFVVPMIQRSFHYKHGIDDSVTQAGILY